ncbi:MAG: hypothetical protein RML72_00095 [Bacteroidia bacterium]|nr:hypothetical protein [Bacteroidia bacterium]MDW8157269.1 hypothetical protein [Bacteroidia bacterium]
MVPKLLLVYIFIFALRLNALTQVSIEERATQIAQQLQKQLDLKIEQKTLIEQILASSLKTIQQIREERKNNPQQKERGVIMQEIQNANKQIEALLDKEQRKKFASYKQEIREHLRQKWQEKRKEQNK